MSSGGYGHLGRIGLITPQANPTAEPEVGLMMPAGVSLLASRCTSAGPARQRLSDYFERLDETLSTFDTLQLDAAGFACTASSYLLDPDDEQRRRAEFEARFGYPIVTAAGAIGEALKCLDASRIAIVCPYPQWLYELALDYWRGAGYEIAASASIQPEMGDTRAIYGISAEEASERILALFAGVDVDAFLITGTGMPGLRAICALQAATGLPAVNSNLCLAWACLRAAGVPFNERSPQPGFPLLGGWEDKITRL